MTFVSDAAACNQKIFDEGVIAIVCAPPYRARRVEQVIKLVSYLADVPVDWSYFAGRVAVRCMEEDADKVIATVRRIIGRNWCYL